MQKCLGGKPIRSYIRGLPLEYFETKFYKGGHLLAGEISQDRECSGNLHDAFISEK
jgi:hypothetical protein